MAILNPKSLAEKLRVQRTQAEEKDAERRAARLGLPYLNLISVKVPTEIKAMRLVPEAEARAAELVPLQLVRKKLVVAVFSPERLEARQILDRLRGDGHEVQAAVVSRSGLEHVFSYYKYVGDKVAEISGTVNIDEKRLENIREKVRRLDDLTALIGAFESPFISQVLEIILGGAIALHASDIHLEPTKSAGGFRVRIDGLLHTVYDTFQLHLYKMVVSRIKLLSNLKLNVVDEPQDGRFTITLKEYDIEIRTSIIPSEYGETAVLRILDPTAFAVSLEELGWRDDDLQIARAEIGKPNGLILNTGPTGSGKTTTLYAFLRSVFKPEIKIITIEDPIEYHLAGISQTQVDQAAGYTFGSGLRSILRQDPDVVLVGEIRDNETADIALNAALTGHLVFSTLHTNDSIGAVPRFLDLGVKPQVLGPALSLVIAQRLVRRLCGECKKARTLTDDERNKFEAFVAGLPARVDKENYREPRVYDPAGCAACGHLGYKGRLSIFELFVKSEAIEELIYKNPTEMELFGAARKEGMVTMQEDGVLKVLAGMTSFAEVERLTGPIEVLK